jgi:hypothetical protein
VIAAIQMERHSQHRRVTPTLPLTTFGGHEARLYPTLPLATEKPHPSGRNAFITEAYTTLPRTLKLGVCTTARTKILVGGPM